MRLEGIFGGVASIVQEAIKIRPLAQGSKRAQGLLVGRMPADVQRGRSGKSVDVTEQPTRSLKEMRETPLPSSSTPESWSNWPAVATLAHFFGDARHRLFGSANAVSSMPEPWVLHEENPHA